VEETVAKLNEILEKRVQQQTEQLEAFNKGLKAISAAVADELLVFLDSIGSQSEGAQYGHSSRDWPDNRLLWPR